MYFFTSTDPRSTPVLDGIELPHSPLKPGSLRVKPTGEKKFTEWDRADHTLAFASLQKIARTCEQYFVFGKQEEGAFNFEIVPYETCSTYLSRLWQQLKVLWNCTFGSPALSEAEIAAEVEKARSRLKTAAKVHEAVFANDAFCKEEVIQKQCVLEGRTINVLFNYAPIGFGGEPLHFLIVPKEHRTRFDELTEEEYLEASELAQKLMLHYGFDAYLYHKTGIDAGQTVPHWHLHLVFSATKTQDLFGKLTVLKNMTWGSSPMKDEALKVRVTSLRSDLHALQDEMDRKSA